MIIIWAIGLLSIIIILAVLLSIFSNWNKLMNYKNLFSFFIIGFIVLTLLFYFTHLEIVIQTIGYIMLIIFSLFYGAFKKVNQNPNQL